MSPAIAVRSKIVVITERMRLGFGVDLVVDEQARGLAEAGYEVVVVVLHADFDQPPRPYRLIVLNRDIHLVNPGSQRAFDKITLRYSLEHTDLWIIHTPPFYNWAAFVTAPVIMIEYGAPPGAFFPPDVGLAIDQMKWRRFNELYPRLLSCDAVLPISRALFDELPPRARAHASVSLLGGDHYPDVPAEEARAFRQSLGVGDDECLILWVGRMQIPHDEQPYKGFRELLDLIPVVRRRAPGVRFVLAGRVSETDQLRLERDGLIVLANQPPEDLAKAFAAADFLINLSLWEGFNLALLEAQYQGTPVVAYDIGPHSEIVRHGATGLLVKTPRELLDTVVRLTGDAGERHRLRANARAFARDFTWAGNIARLIKTVVRCLESAPDRDIIVGRRLAAGRAVTITPPPSRRTIKSAILPVLFGGAPGMPWRDLNPYAFAQFAHRILLGREPEQSALDSLVQRLTAGESRASVLASLCTSPDARRRMLGDPQLVELVSRHEAATRQDQANERARHNEQTSIA